MGRRPTIPAVAKSPEESADIFDWLAQCTALDCPASSTLTQQIPGRQPTRIGLIADAATGRYRL